MALVLSPMVLLSLRIIAPLVVLGTAGAAICVAGYFFPAIGCLFWPRAGKVAALGGLLAGGAAALATFWTMPLGLHNAVWGFIVGGIVFLALAFVTPPPSPEKQKKFHSLFSKTIYGISET
jgi:Na+/proline symporter